MAALISAAALCVTACFGANNNENVVAVALLD